MPVSTTVYEMAEKTDEPAADDFIYIVERTTPPTEGFDRKITYQTLKNVMTIDGGAF